MEPDSITHGDIDFSDKGMLVTFHYTKGEDVMFFIPNKWLLPLSSAMKGRLGFLDEAGIFTPEP